GRARDAGHVRALMQQAGFPPSTPLLGGPDLHKGGDFAAAAGAAALGSYAVDPVLSPDDWDPATDFLAAYRQHYSASADLDPGVIYAYDATRAFLEAFRSLVVY